MKRGSRRNRLMDLWLGIPLLNLLASVRWRRARPDHIQRIGLMCSLALGDTLLFSAVLRDVRAHFPGAHIVHFCMRPNLAAAEMIHGADQCVILNLTRPWESVRAMRACPMDLMLDFSSWQRLTAFLTLMSGARFTAGFDSPGQHRGRGYDLAVKHRNDQHELENFRDVVRAVGIPAGAEPAVVLPEFAPGSAAPFADEQDLVVLHLWASGARGWLREWPEDRWIELAARLAGERTLFVVTGGPADVPRMTAFCARMEQAGLRAAAMAGKDGFVSLTRVLQRARVVVSVNTGVMHLAAIVGAPTVSLNGPTSNRRWGPVGPCVLGIGPADGSGGYLNFGFEFDGQPEDVMLRMSVEQAVTAAHVVMDGCGARRGG